MEALTFPMLQQRLTEIQKLLHDSNKTISDKIPANVREKKMKEIEETKIKANQEIMQLLGEIEKSKGEQGRVLLEKVIESIKVVEKISEQPKADKNLTEIPKNAKDYGEYFNSEVYQAILPFTQLAFLYEEIGDAKDHALKLTVLFGDVQSALNYLRAPDLDSVHDACLYSLPLVAKCDFKQWRLLAKKYIDDGRFRRLLANADEIEKLMKENAKIKGKQPDHKLMRAKKEEIAATSTTLKNLNKELEREDLTDEQDIELETKKKQASSKLFKLNLELVALSEGAPGIPLANTDLPYLNAYYDKFLNSTSKAYSIFVSHGLTKRDNEKFIKLDRRDAGKNIPDIKIEGKDIGYPGFYFRKVNIQDENEAGRAACFGKMTNCCQSLSGEAGEPCTIHGLTSPNGGFFILCKGDPNNPKDDDELYGQSWVWRSQSGALVFDSVEIPKIHKTPKNISMVSDFYRVAGNFLINEPTFGIPKVNCGSVSGISKDVGLSSAVPELPVDYSYYRDSRVQNFVAIANKPYLLLGKTTSQDSQKKLKGEVEDLIKSELSKNSELKNAIKLIAMIGYAISTNQPALLTLLRENAKERAPEIEKLIEINQTYHEKLKQGEVDLSLLNEGADVNLQDNQGKTAIYLVIEKGEPQLVSQLLARGADVNVIDENGRTPLHLAAKQGLTETVALLLQNKAMVHIKDKNEISPLYEATESDNLEIMTQLLTHGASVNTRNFKDGRLPIHIAAIKGNVEAVALLLENGADINKHSFEVMTPLHYAIYYNHPKVIDLLLNKSIDFDLKDASNRTAMDLAVEKNHPSIIKTLLAKGAPLLSKGRLAKAIQNDQQELVELLLSHATDITKTEYEKALLSAAKKGNAKLVSLLLAKGVDVDMKDNAGNPLLYSAIEAGSDEIAAILLLSGANLDFQDKWGRKPLLIAAACGLDEQDAQMAYGQGSKPLVDEATLSRRTTIFNDILAKSSELNSQDETGKTALMWAALAGNEDIIDTLLAKKVEVNIQDKDGNTALSWAIRGGHPKIVQKLFENGAKIETPTNLLLLDAVFKNDAELVRILLANGANLSCKTARGNTPLQLAVRKKNMDMIAALLDYGADMKEVGDSAPANIRIFMQNYAETLKATQKHTPQKLLFSDMTKHSESSPLAGELQPSVSDRKKKKTTPD